ncbi:SDR family NAD(P)-dependent oxidoreductase [Candidatus Kaiserbacteria bacterium]|nr:SDR family NAD(P)-dependent oxidoreductase [Candidatus Kaiserbacteria bacterium]
MNRALVTGAAKGLGLALVDEFAKNGWHVIAACHRASDFPARSYSDMVEVTEVDLQDDTSINALVSCVGDRAVDVLVNNAGVYDAKEVADEDQEQIDNSLERISEIFQVNSIAPKLLTDRLAPNIARSEKKLVVTISSGMGTYAKLKNEGTGEFSAAADNVYHAKHWPYCASKTAVNYSMLAFGIEHPDIQSVLINPGWMRTNIGGPDATLSPEQSAASIFKLITTHETSLPNGKLVDYNGDIMQL